MPLFSLCSPQSFIIASKPVPCNFDFISSQTPGASYRDTEQVRRSTKDGNKEGGFLYGTSAIKRFEKKDPATRPNNKLLLEEIT